MGKVRTFGLALALATTSVATFAGPMISPAIAAPVSEAKMIAARSLAEATNPKQTFYDTALGNFKAEMRASFTGDPDIASLEGEYPGFTDFGVDWTYEFMRGQLDIAFPELMDVIAIVYVQHMTLADIKAADAFFRTPTGQKLVNRSFEGQSLPSATEDCITEGKENCLESSELASITRKANIGAYQSLTPKERAASDAFANSTAGKSFAKASALTMNAMADWGNAWFQRLGSEMMAALPGAMSQWIDEQEHKAP